ncbi:hypothetical protein DFH07DRAFT_969158 [Mycena maculata]|uniref:Uncharacterized protein n=1 Tax=Mycena maculata TaxID=230809 RepID=A0AAD7MSU4_9AGAR|nr:hypothetical protein DFH07DRAFT_969158 [Mycena maculata]
MPPRFSLPPTSLSFPGCPLDELLVLTQQLTPSESPQTVRKIHHLFRDNRLLEVYVSIIRGPRGAEGLFEGNSKLPQAKCLKRIHKITRITPGVIVTTGSLLVKVSDETTIDYDFFHQLYICRIREGLRDGKAWATGLLEYWNHVLFPNADKSYDYGAAGNEQLMRSSTIVLLKHRRPQSALSPSHQLSARRRRRRATCLASPDILANPDLSTPALTLLFIISSIINLNAHRIPDASSCTTCRHKGAILFLTMACNPERL